MIDPHVHLRDWTQSIKETISHGLSLASSFGFKYIFDMPNTNPTITTRFLIEKRLLDAEKVNKYNILYSVYGGLTADENQIEEMVKAHTDLFPKVCGLKYFASGSTGNMGIIKEKDQQLIYNTLSKLNYRGVLVVHSEKEAYFNKKCSNHSDIRPSISEIKSVKDQIDFATKAKFKGTLLIPHISTRGALELVKYAKQRNKIKILAGATPHHILLNRNNTSPYNRMNPPLRCESDRLAIWNGLFDGSINHVESDHAPHTLKDKEKKASGIPGFEGMLRLIKTLRKKGMKEKRLTELFCINALKAFNMEYNFGSVPIITYQMIEKAKKAYPFSVWI